MGCTVAIPRPVPLDVGTGFEGAAGRLLGVGFSGSCLVGVGLSRPRLLDSAVYGQPAISPAGFQKLALYLGILRGAVSPDVSKGYGRRVSLPVAHYSDSSPQSW